MAIENTNLEEQVLKYTGPKQERISHRCGAGFKIENQYALAGSYLKSLY